MLENACGLLKHADFKEIMRAMGFCGYTLVAQRVCDADPRDALLGPGSSWFSGTAQQVFRRRVLQG